MTERIPLSRDRVLRAAVDVADREGLGALTMRRLGSELGVEAMSLYKHVANKDEILDGIVDLVMGEIHVPGEDVEWRESMRLRARSAREVLSRHAWIVGLMESRGSSGPTVLGYADAILGKLRSAGLSVEAAGYGFWLLDSFVYGHVVQEAAGSARAGTPTGDTGPEYPHLAEVEAHAATGAFTLDGAFETGLELILDGLDRRVTAE